MPLYDFSDKHMQKLSSRIDPHNDLSFLTVIKSKGSKEGFYNHKEDYPLEIEQYKIINNLNEYYIIFNNTYLIEEDKDLILIAKASSKYPLYYTLLPKEHSIYDPESGLLFIDAGYVFVYLREYGKKWEKPIDIFYKYDFLYHNKACPPNDSIYYNKACSPNDSITSGFINLNSVAINLLNRVYAERWIYNELYYNEKYFKENIIDYWLPEHLLLHEDLEKILKESREENNEENNNFEIN